MLQYFLISSILEDYNKLMLHILTLSQQVQYGQHGFTPKKHSSLDANSKAGSPVKLCNFKTQHHHGSKTAVIDNKVEILDTEGTFIAKKKKQDKNNSVSLFAVHQGKGTSLYNCTMSGSSEFAVML